MAAKGKLEDLETGVPVAVIGTGSWGTALAKLLGEKGMAVHLWGRREELTREMQRSRENKIYLPGFFLPHTIQISSSLDKIVEGSPCIIMAVPSHVYRAVLREALPYIQPGSIIVSATKGIENETLCTMTQVMEDECQKIGKNYSLAVLSGPSFAREVAQGVPTAVAVAAKDKAVAKRIQNLFFTGRFRVYANSDVVGVELGGPLKNIVAIAAGISDGLGYGTNTRAAIITRGLAEITRMGVKMGANPLTFSGLSGLGDLVLTCTGELSRNRMVGLKLGQGKSLDDILREMNMVAEGVKTAKSAWELARRLNVEMPILEQVYFVLYENKPCFSAVQSLLSRDQKEEIYFLEVHPGERGNIKATSP